MSELVVGSLKGLAANSFVIDVASGSKIVQPGAVLQVVSTTKTDVFSSSSTSMTNITGLSASITPSSATSKILVSVAFGGISIAASEYLSFRLLRGATAISIGDSAGSRDRVSMSYNPGVSTNFLIDSGAFQFLDTPATTSATTYQVQMRVSAGTGNVNRTAVDTDAGAYPRTITTITLTEIAG